MAFETQFEPSAKSPDPAIPRETVMMARRSGLGLLILAGIVCAMQLVQGTNSDTSWLLTVAERWLDGARPYVDILESNPPASVLSLIPAVWLARLLGCTAETIVPIATCLAALVAIEASIRLAPGSGSIRHLVAYRLISGFALLVLPVSIFAEREHLAVIALWPMWSVMGLRADGRRVAAALIAMAGLGAGLAMAFKPQFAVMILLPAIGVTVLRRSILPLISPEYWIAGAFFAVYGIGVYFFLTAYFAAMVPLVIAYYLPIREPAIVILSGQVMPSVALAVAGLGLIARDRWKEPAIVLPVLAGLGGLIMVVEQAKGFAYHYYPLVAALVPALLGPAMVIANARLQPGTPLPARLLVVAGFLAIAIGIVGATIGFFGPSQPFSALIAPIRDRFQHPRIMSLSAHIWVGHPLARDVNGTWVGTVPNQWITLGALYRLGLGTASATERRDLSAAIEADKTRAAADIAAKRPDILIVERDDRVMPAWFASPGEVDRFLTGYIRVGTAYDVVDVWARKR